MKYLKIMMLSLTLLCGSVLAERQDITGMIRKYSDLIIFWPCSNPLPHYVIVDSGAKVDMAGYFLEPENLYVTVDAEITNEQTRGQDGTIIIYQLLDSAETLNCVSWQLN